MIDNIKYLFRNLISNRRVLAQILGISANDLEKETFSKDEMAHINRVAVCVKQVALYRHGKLYPRYVVEKIFVKTPSLSELLSRKDFDLFLVTASLNKAWDMSENLEKRNSEVSDRLKSLNFPKSTESQRKATSEYNKLMHDLGKE